MLHRTLLMLERAGDVELLTEIGHSTSTALLVMGAYQ